MGENGVGRGAGECSGQGALITGSASVGYDSLGSRMA